MATTVLSSAAMLAASYTNASTSSCSSDTAIASANKAVSTIGMNDDVLLKHVIIV